MANHFHFVVDGWQRVQPITLHLLAGFSPHLLHEAMNEVIT